MIKKRVGSRDRHPQIPRRLRPPATVLQVAQLATPAVLPIKQATTPLRTLGNVKVFHHLADEAAVDEGAAESENLKAEQNPKDLTHLDDLTHLGDLIRHHPDQSQLTNKKQD